MNPQYRDVAIEKAKWLIRTASNYTKVAGPPIMVWLLRHKATVVIILLVLYIFFVHDSAPKLKGAAAGNETPVVVVAPATTQPATTQPTTEPSAPGVTPQLAGDIALYNPDAEGADPKWSLPAELSNADIRTFIEQVNNLANEYNLANELENRYDKSADYLTNDQIFGLYWTRVTGGGFRDTNLPLDWYQVVKDRQFGILAKGTAAVEWAVKQSITDAVTTRFRYIQTRLVGGKLLIGDELFIKTFQVYEDDRLKRFKRLAPIAESVSGRTASEFQKELQQHSSDNGLPNQG